MAKKIDRSKLNRVERELLDGFDELLTDLKSGAPLEKKYSIRRMKSNLEPANYGPAQAKQARKMLNVSQRLFARFLGVSVQAVRAWEQGDNTPSRMARRWMDEIQRDPDYWKKRIRDLVDAANPIP